MATNNIDSVDFSGAATNAFSGSGSYTPASSFFSSPVVSAAAQYGPLISNPTRTISAAATQYVGDNLPQINPAVASALTRPVYTASRAFGEYAADNMATIGPLLTRPTYTASRAFGEYAADNYATVASALTRPVYTASRAFGEYAADNMATIGPLLANPVKTIAGATVNYLGDRLAAPKEVGESPANAERFLEGYRRINASNETPSDRVSAPSGEVKADSKESAGPGPSDFYFSDLFGSTLSEGWTADSALRDRMVSENKAARKENKTPPYSASEVLAVEERIRFAEAQNSFISGYLSKENFSENPTREEVVSQLTSSLMEERGIRLPDNLSVAGQQQFEVAKRAANRRVDLALSSSDAASLETLPATIQTVFDEYSARVSNEVIQSIDPKLSTSEFTTLPRGYSYRDQTGLKELSQKYTNAADQLQAVVGPEDRRVIQLKTNAEEIAELAEGAPSRAEAYRARRNPLSYLIRRGEDQASHLAGQSAEVLSAYARDLAADPRMEGLRMDLDEAMEGHKSGSVTNEQLQTAIEDYVTEVSALTANMNPVIKNTWYGQQRASGRDLDFGKLAGMSALILGLYEATYGKERAREQNLEDMMALERFRTDERLRLYSGQVAARGGGGSGTSGTAPAGSSALASIAERVS